MAQMWAALMGAVVAGGIAILTQWLGGRQSRSATLDDQRAARLGEFLAATQSAVLIIGDLARLPAGTGHEGKDVFRRSSAMMAAHDRVNSVLNAIQLLDDERVVAAVVSLDRSLVRLEDEAMKQQWTRDSWRVRRNEVLGDTVDRV